jgi:hypothetical protein
MLFGSSEKWPTVPWTETLTHEISDYILIFLHVRFISIAMHHDRHAIRAVKKISSPMNSRLHRFTWPMALLSGAWDYYCC